VRGCLGEVGDVSWAASWCCEGCAEFLKREGLCRQVVGVSWR
jgi:hypothetical protein